MECRGKRGFSRRRVRGDTTKVGMRIIAKVRIHAQDRDSKANRQQGATGDAGAHLQHCGDSAGGWPAQALHRHGVLELFLPSVLSVFSQFSAVLGPVQLFATSYTATSLSTGVTYFGALILGTYMFIIIISPW